MGSLLVVGSAGCMDGWMDVGFSSVFAHNNLSYPPPPPNLPILPSERFISYGGIGGELKNAVWGQTRGKVERPI